ncbi:Protoporphyrinogen oxidase [Trametes gibbosa]|nr:Protoporphyrinogen oxidase [Trametes gibbosa]
MGPARAITVLGGGLSGLSAAFHLSRRFPARSGTRITLVEKSTRLGGWVQSERVRVKDKHGREAEVLLESGPRTLRPASQAILELIHLLQLEPSVLTVSSKAPAARNRFLYLPGKKGLVTIPSTILSLLFSPLAKILIPAVLQDLRQTDGLVLNTSYPHDESVDAFLTRHFGPLFALTFGSALVHGIYAADSRLLSVRAAFAAMCRLEEGGGGSVVRGALKEMLSSFKLHQRRAKSQADGSRVYEVGEVNQLMKGVSVYSFRDGMQTLTDAMVNHLRDQENVDLIQGDAAVSLSKAAADGRFCVTMSSGQKIVGSHLISTLPLPHLHQLLASTKSVRTSARPTPELQRTVPVHKAKLPPPPFPHPALSVGSNPPGRYTALLPNSRAEHPAITSEKPPASVTTSLPPLPHILSNPSSSVTVVNLIFPPSDTPIHPEGFGYLIPRPASDYPGQGSTLGMLGTVFDSCALGGQDVSISADRRSSKFTKVTVMLGGPYGPPSPEAASPEFLYALLGALQQHLGHNDPLPEPVLVRVRQHRDCIPTPTVGHVARIVEMQSAVKQTLGENAAVIGAGVAGVSVGDCIESGRRAALEL